MTSTFFVLSIGSLALSLGLWRSVSSTLRFLPGHLFWLTWACAVFLAGIYPGDLQGSPQTRIGQIHNQMGAIAFPSAALALLLLSFPLLWEQKWRPVWGIAVVLSLAVVACFLMWDRLEGIRLGGLDQRVFLSITLAWMLILARKLPTIELPRKAEGS